MDKTKGLLVVGLIAATTMAVVVFKPKSPTTTTIDNYKNGSYSAVGEYTSPGRSESIQVKMTLKNNIIRDVEVESQAIKPISQKFQKEFIAGYKELVVGKNISDLKLDKVSGSSLTPKGFNDAIEKIRNQSRI